MSTASSLGWQLLKDEKRARWAALGLLSCVSSAAHVGGAHSRCLYDYREASASEVPMDSCLYRGHFFFAYGMAKFGSKVRGFRYVDSVGLLFLGASGWMEAKLVHRSMSDFVFLRCWLPRQGAGGDFDLFVLFCACDDG